jgi:tRNA A37 threonylcarbamoyladenosine modification protein TsaB
MLLAIDTATHYASVALHDGSRLLAEHTWLANQAHTRSLLPAVQGLLKDAGSSMNAISAVAVALGPGSFNGLRVGLSTAKGLAIALAIPLVGASTLELLAAEYEIEEVTQNAGRGRVYHWATGDDPAAIRLLEGSAPDRVRHAGVLAAVGWQRLRSGDALDAAKVQPLYVQPPEITESRRKAHMQAA